MSAQASLIPELEEVIQRGSSEKRTKTLRRVTTFFLDGASQFNDDHLGLFGLVFSRLIAGAEVKARAELAHRLAPLGTVPAEVVLRLAHDDDIAVAGPVLAQSRQLAETDLVTIARTQSEAHLLAIAGRARIGEAVTDVLVRRGAREVAHRVADNPGARLSERSFCTLVERAKSDSILAEKVGLRPDIPARLSATSCSRPRRWCGSACSHRPRPRCRRSSDAFWRKICSRRVQQAPLRTTRPRNAQSRLCAKAACSVRRRSSNSLTKGSMRRRWRRSHRFARCRPRWWID
jgi:Uncharacterized protein conserved in bacteria